MAKINQRARSELSYEWICKYDDGTELRQYDDIHDEEYNFRHIDQGKLVEFALVSKSDPSKSFSINVKNGVFSIDGKEITEITVNNQPVSLGFRFSDKDKVESKIGNKAAVIYYRRVQRAVNPFDGMAFGKVLEMASTNLLGMWYFIGWEATINGTYYKFEIAFDSHGNLMIPPKSNFTPL